MNNNRSWMYERIDDRGFLNSLFISGVEDFMNYAISQPTSMGGTSIQCPCSKCKNRKFLNGDMVKLHLLKNGFVKDYYVWSRHGESSIYNENDEHPSTNHSNISRGTDGSNLMYNMVINAAGPSFDPHDSEEMPNAAAQNIYNMLKSSERELYDGCETSQLAAMAQMLSLKSDHHWSEACYDQTSQFVKGILPEDNTFLDSFYSTKKHMEGLGLPSIHIDCCVNGCMIYWNEDIDMESCKFCSQPRYKIRVHRSTRERKKVAVQKMIYFPLAPRLQRLYASPTTAAHMRWHADHYKEDGVMRHCSDSEEWKQFDRAHPLFSSEIRNVRLGLSADGFQPFGSSGKQYSSWPIIVTPYNLPPWMCSKEEYMFLSILVPGPRNPKQKIDVFLQPLVSELKMLWEVGVETWDTSLKQNFQMRAALMWTISDFPAYSMLSGWKTAGHLACPHCAHDHDAYNLKHGGKTTWFDNHRKFLPRNHPFRKNKNWFTKGKVVSEFPPPIRTGEDVLQEIESLGLMKITELGSEEHNARIIKTYNCGWKKRSIFWDLPYWRTLSIRHNLDVMHIEKNVFENLFNTIMAIEGKTKDNAKARADIALICRRPELAINESTQKYPKACYSLDKKGKEAVCKWLQDLKFPDGYVSNMGRCIDMKKYKLFGMKSHDCHVFMQRLLPIAFREFLPNNVWEAVTELSLFFRDLASSTLKVSDMCRLEEQIPVILCKLERIFPPALFDSMEHLLVHLPYEARIAGPVQYRWMSARRLRLTSSPNPGNSTEHTPIRSQRSQTEHTPAQSRVLSSASANEPEHASESEDPYWEVGSMHDDGRMRVEVISGLLEPSGRCSRAITDSISERQDPDGFSWKAVSKEVKDFYFDEFKKTCVWRQDDRIIHKAWAKKASVRYTNFCSDARARWEKGGQDSRVAMHVWLRWVEFWKTPNFQVKSNTQKKNRKGGADKYPPTHTGGSASLRTHAAVLAKTQGKDPTPADVYLITHTVKHDKKTFVTKKAEQVYKRVETLREELSAPIEGSDEPQVVDEDQLFLKAAGGLDKKSRVYGMGSLQSVIYGPETGGSRHRGSNFRHEEYKQMQVELQDMKNQVKELQEMRNQELEEMRKQMEEMKNQLALVFNHQN